MTVTSEITIANAKLVVKGETILSEVPENVVLTASTGTVAQGAFLGATSTENSSRHLFSLGVLRNLRFMCCFRFNLWWMTQRMGLCGREVPLETQFLLLESHKSDPVYTVFLPLLDGSFRASLQGNGKDELLLCVESGCPDVKGMSLSHSLFVLAGKDPFQVIEDAVQAVQDHMQTFRRRVEKQMPGMLNYFGWCTWDAFYTEVTPEGVKAGLRSLNEGGTPAKLLIIDDGWQSVANDGRTDDCIEKTTDEEQFSRRLTDIKENVKFLCKDKDNITNAPDISMKTVIAQIKDEFAVKYVYVWHALAGYWGGVNPDNEKTRKYGSLLKYPKQSADILQNQLKNGAADNMAIHGVALVPPENVFQFYNDYHSYLAHSGVDGVKVDSQNILETLGDGLGGRVSLVQQYQQSLEASIAQNFPDNGIIACMSHNNDGLYSIKNTAVVRASDDFWPRDPASHTIHIASVAYNSVFLGEFMQPDWDMFQSLHPAAEYHAAARAIGGCPVYVSDKPGQHNFDVLKKLVLPDGSILRAQLPGRPTKDCLFSDPARDGKSLLKIWNMNKYTGVVGAFNCQGAGWCKEDKVYVIHDKEPVTVTSSIRSEDINSLSNIIPDSWDGDCAVYSHRKGDITCLPKGGDLPVTLKVLEFEIFTVSPVMKLDSGVHFAPIGLLRMFNSGGAVVSLDYTQHKTDFNVECEANLINCKVQMKIHGSGEFGFYSSMKPRDCLVDSKVKELDVYAKEESRKRDQALIIAEMAKKTADTATKKYDEALMALVVAKLKAEEEAHRRREAEARAKEEALNRQIAVSALKDANLMRYREYTYEELKFATNNFSEANQIGIGGYGPVYKGRLHHTLVAIKVLKKDSVQGLKEFQQEVDFLSRMHHPHLVLLLGACTEQACLVYEYLSNGSLYDLLIRKRGLSPPLPWHTRFRIAAEVATALLFLHSTKPDPYVHRDLKPANILLDNNFSSKLGDVGLTRLAPAIASESITIYKDTNIVGTCAYIDPEYQRTGFFNPKSDIYALGIVMLQLLTGGGPLGISAIVEMALRKETLNEVLDSTCGEWPINEATEMAKLAIQCSQMQRRSRPDLETDVLPKLQKLRAFADDYIVQAAWRGRTVSQDHLTIPSFFLCPITKEPMKNPHIAADGYTYEYKAIKQWLRDHRKSPITNLKLPHKQLTPNYSLRSAISDWNQRLSYM